MNELYDAKLMDLSNDPELRLAQEKILKNEELSPREKLIIGRDHPITSINGYEFKSNYVYRCVNEETYKLYLESGFVYGKSKDDEYQEYTENGKIYNNNKGVDWYLGGASFRYGGKSTRKFIIGCPAYKEYFFPAYDNGCHMSFNPLVRHMKSSGYIKPLPMSLIELVYCPPDYQINNEISKNNFHK